MYVSNPSMEDCPEHVVVEILSRLPVKTIIQCKCVCKKWLDLVSDAYFANLHLSRSPAGLMIHNILFDEEKAYLPGVLKLVEIKDELDHHHLHQDPVMSLDLYLAPIFHESRILLIGSVHGLLCLWHLGPDESFNTYVCNPITREYMILPKQREYTEDYATIVYGFGVGSLTKEYKVIRISQYCLPPNPTETYRPKRSLSEVYAAEVYTLGTGQWRSLGPTPYWLYGFYGPFLNGHAHWSICDENSPEKIYAFDFDNETFNLFPSPPVETIQESETNYRNLAVVKGCLCQCYDVDSEFTLWVMKEYGIKKSWHKEVIIKGSICPGLDRDPLYPIEHLRDGTILILSDERKLMAYSCEKGTIADTNLFECYFTGVAYRPSFLKLRNFESERVNVF